MAKTLLPNQCDLLHQYYPTNECCLCRAEARIRELEEQIKKLRKLPDNSPPLLTEDESDGLDEIGLLEAQRIADIRHYTE